MSTQFLFREAGPFVESGGEVLLTPDVVGYKLDMAHTRHIFQVTTLAGGNVDIQVLGPADVWADHTTGATEGDVIDVTDGPWKAFKAVFNATGAAGEVSIRSYATDFSR